MYPIDPRKPAAPATQQPSDASSSQPGAAQPSPEATSPGWSPAPPPVRSVIAKIAADAASVFTSIRNAVTQGASTVVPPAATGPGTPDTLVTLRASTDAQLQALSKQPLSPPERQAAAARIIQGYFEQAKAAGIGYRPEPDGGTSLIDEATEAGGQYQVNLGADGHYDCTEAALESQRFFKEAGVDAQLNIVQNPGGSDHALLDLGGKSFDATRALTGGQALGGRDKRPVLGSFTPDQVKDLFDHGGSEQSATAEAKQLQVEKAAALKANMQADDGGPNVPPTTAPTSKQPLDPGQKQAADRDFEKIKKAGGGATREFITLANDHKDQPDYLAELVDRAKAKSPGTLDSMMGGLNGAFRKDPAGKYGAGYTDADRQTIVDALNIARSKGYLTDQEIRDHAAPSSQGWLDVANRMGVSAAGVDPASEDATSALQKAQSEYSDAHKGVEELDQQMQKELAKFGGALDDKQRATYVAKFKDLHKDEYGNEAKTAEALAKVLEDNRGTLEDAAIRDPQARGKLYTALKDVASSDTPKVALEYSADLARPENGNLRAAFAKYPDFEKEVAQPAMAGTPAQLMVENGGHPKDAFAQLNALAQPLIENYGKPGYDLFKAPGDVKEAWSALAEASEGKFDKLEKLAEGWKKQPPGALVKGIASAGLSIGLGLYGGATGVEQGNLTKAINGFSEAGAEGLETVAGATKAIADSGKLAQYTDKALKFADFAEKLAPGLGAIANGTSFLEHLKKARDNHNVGYAIAAAGDLVATLGSVAECIPSPIPLPQAAGMFADAIGTAVSALGELIGNAIDDGRLKDEERKVLKASGFSDSMADALTSTSPDRVKELSKDLKLTPAQIQKLAAKYPSLLLDTGKGYPLTAVKGIQREWNLDPEQLTDLLDAIGQGSSDPNKTMCEFALTLSTKNWNHDGPVSQVEYRNEIQEKAGAQGDAIETVGFKNALTWLDGQRTTTEGLGGPGHSRSA